MAQQTNHIVDTNKMMTAVDWLWNESLKKLLQASDFEQAKAMEKEQIIKAHMANDDDGNQSDLYLQFLKDVSEMYYNNTYKNDTQGKI